MSILSQIDPEYRTPLAVLGVLVGLSILACGGGSGPSSFTLDDPDDMFVGSYTQLEAQIPSSASYTFSDVTFEISGPTNDVRLSRSQQSGTSSASNATTRTITVLAGPSTGKYTLEAKQGGNTLTSKTFRVTRSFSSQEDGPSYWFQGTVEGKYHNVSAGADGGEGSGTSVWDYGGDQTGTRRVKVILTEFSDHGFTKSTSTIKTRWKNHMFDGVGSQNASAASYYEEVSGSSPNLTVKGSVVGPVELEGELLDYRGEDSKALMQGAITAAYQNKGVDFTNTDSVFIVPADQAVDTSASCSEGDDEVCNLVDDDCDGDVDEKDSELDECPDKLYDKNGTTVRNVWPRASIGASGPFQIASDKQKRLGWVRFPPHWGFEYRSNRKINETGAHELAHNLGLGDLYKDNGEVRTVGGWSLMDADWLSFPHLTVSERMKLGWIPDSQIKHFEPSGTSQQTQTVDLSAIETMSAGSNRYLGVEMEIANGWHYYWAYRRGQSMQVGDQGGPVPQAPDPGVVFGSDHLTNSSRSAVKRRPIAKVPVTGDSDGPDLAEGDRYNKENSSNPNVLSAEVLLTDANKAELEISHKVPAPDPSIREWNPEPWKSPDIEVQNKKTRNSDWEDTLWANHDNDVIATIHNDGETDAQQVKVNFFAQKFNASGESIPEQLIGTKTVDVPANDEKDVEITFRPNGTGHMCVKVKIEPYQTPNTKVQEASPYNNRAQSNYTAKESESSSPASRARVPVAVKNPDDSPRTVFLRATHDKPQFRSYVEHRWIRLDANEEKEVDLMVEYRHGADFSSLTIPESGEDPKALASLEAWLAPEGDNHTGRLLGGTTVAVRPGYATSTELTPPTGGSGSLDGTVKLAGRSSSGSNDSQTNDKTNNNNNPNLPDLQTGINQGKVVIWVDRADGSREYFVTGVGNGSFGLEGSKLGDWTEIGAEYLGKFPYSGSEAEAVQND